MSETTAVHAPSLPQLLPQLFAAPQVFAELTATDFDDVGVLALGVAPSAEEHEGIQPRGGCVDAALRYGIDLAELAERTGGDRFRGNPGEFVVLNLPQAHDQVPMPWGGYPDRLVLVGVGDCSVTALRRAGAALARSLQTSSAVVSAVTQDLGAAEVAAFAEGYMLGAYTPPNFRASARSDKAPLTILNTSPQILDQAHHRAAATWFVRDLAQMPSNLKSPRWMSDLVSRCAHEAGVTVTLRDATQLKAEQFGGITAVGSGSSNPPTLLVAEYVPQQESGQHVVIVGKGITYDTGGLSIKPREAMVSMKSDMTGAAVAAAVVLGAAREHISHRVTAVMPLAENHVGAASYRPGDVLRIYGGRTVEVIDTDAEGRLVLADGIAFAVDRLAPDLMIDVATLTGAASVGLGRGYGAMMTRDTSLSRQMLEAGLHTGEKVWPLPLVDDYRPALDSTVADIRHLGGDVSGQSVRAGSVVAGLFLEEFTGGLPWVHLDIAGPARATAARDEVCAGATGFGARLILEFLHRWSPETR